MRTVRTLKPGQNGTSELMIRFGSNLLCVQSTRAGAAARQVALRIGCREKDVQRRVLANRGRRTTGRNGQLTLLEHQLRVSLTLNRYTSLLQTEGYYPYALSHRSRSQFRRPRLRS